jgi:hypothetical protein
MKLIQNIAAGLKLPTLLPQLLKRKINPLPNKREETRNKVKLSKKLNFTF